MTTEQPTTGDAPEAQQAQTSGNNERLFTQAELDAIVRDRLDRERRKSQEMTAKAQQEAAEKALQEQGEYKKLADQLAAKVAVLEPATQQIAAYDEVMQPHIAARIEALPEAMRSLIDADDSLGKLRQLNKVEAAARAMRPAEPTPAQPLRSTARGPVNNQAPAAGTALASDILLEKRARMGSL